MYKTPDSRRSWGFTLVEMLVVLGIIGVLVSVIYASFSEARANSRDKKRIADVEQIGLAMRLYVEQYGSKINCPNGLKIDGSGSVTILPSTGNCTDGTQILSFLQTYFSGKIPTDPNGPNNNDYYYYFDATHNCPLISGGSETVAMVFAVNLESTRQRSDSNLFDLCPYFVNGTGNDGGLEETVSFSGTITQSTPYVKGLQFISQ